MIDLFIGIPCKFLAMLALWWLPAISVAAAPCYLVAAAVLRPWRS